MKVDKNKKIPKEYRAFSVTRYREEADFLENIRSIVFLWLGIFVFMGWLGQIFQLNYSRMMMVILALFFTVIIEMIQGKLSGANRIATYISIAIFSIIMIFFPVVRNGFRGFFYDAYKTLSKRGVLVFYKGASEDSFLSHAMAVFVIICWLYLLLRFCLKYMNISMVCLPFIMLLMEIRFGNGEGAIWFFLCICWIFLPMVTTLRSYLFLMTIPIILLCLFLFWGLEDQGGWQAAWTHLRYGDNNEVLPDGKLSQASEMNRSSDRAFLIEGDNQGYYYLKGFVGTIYKDNAWSNDDQMLDDFEADLVAGNDQFLSWLHDKGYSGWNQLSSSVQNDKINLITIHNEGASSKYLYLPYEMKTTMRQIESERMAASGPGEGLWATGIFGRKDYRIKMASSYAGAEISSSLNGKGINSEYDTYEEYVYRTCLALPKNVKESLRNILESNNILGKEDTMAAVHKVRKWLKENVTYQEKLDQETVESEFSEWFFQKKAEGFDVQYATAAVMLFRYYGIPSRYVEGYMVEENSTVSQEAAHAWPEVYITGKGWVPVEVMESYMERMPSYLPENGEEIKSSDKDIEEVEEEENRQDQDDEKNPNNQEETTTEQEEETTQEENGGDLSQEEGQNSEDQGDGEGESTEGEEERISQAPIGDKQVEGFTFLIYLLVMILFLLMVFVIVILRLREVFLRRWATESISPERSISMWYQYCIWLIYLLEEKDSEKRSMATDNRLLKWEYRWRKHHRDVDKKALHQVCLLRQKAIYYKKGVSMEDAEKAKIFFKKEYRYFYRQLKWKDRWKVWFGIRPKFINKTLRH